MSEEDVFPESDPEPESGPAPILGAPMSLPPVSADMPLPMFVPGTLPLRVEVEESDVDELESEDEELEAEELEEEESEEVESDEEELDEEELELPGPEPLPMSSPDGPSYPSTRLSIACRARLPAF